MHKVSSIIPICKCMINQNTPKDGNKNSYNLCFDSKSGTAWLFHILANLPKSIPWECVSFCKETSYNRITFIFSLWH